jgi:hypothetical protein
MASFESIGLWIEVLLEERNRRQEAFIDPEVARMGELVWLEVFRLKTLKERLGVGMGFCDDSLSVGGAVTGNGRETSKLDLLICGTVFRLSEKPKKERVDG